MLYLPPWLPQTKLRAPRLRDDTVARPRALGILGAALATSRLVLVSAPAGSGKTTLLASLAAQPGPAAPRLAWLSLDANDDEPHMFLAALVAALRHALPGFGERLLAALQHQGGLAPPPLRLVGLLINELLDSLASPCVLVLDDLHLLSDPAIFAALDYLVEHMPDQLRVVALTRADPPLALARLRARGQLSELRLPDLRFTLDEAAELLNERLRLELGPEVVRALESATEGWAAGLRVLAGALAGRTVVQRGAIVEQLGGGTSHLFELFAAEVLDRQPAPIRRFLLETAILDELTPQSCAGVTATPDASLLLDEVARRNLFLVALGDGFAPAYRYHALFGAFLRRRLALERPTDLPALHQRAAGHVPPEQAIRHYIAAEAWDEAAEGVLALAEKLFGWGWLDRLRGLIEPLPPHARERHPWLSYYLGACAWGQSRFAAARPHLDAALARFVAGGDAAGQGEALVLLGTLHQTAGLFAEAREAFAQARGRPLSPRSRAQLHMGEAWIALSEGDDGAVAAALDAALGTVEASGDPGAVAIVTIQLREVFCLHPLWRAAVSRALLLSERAEHASQRPGLLASAQALRAVQHLMAGEVALAAEATSAALGQSAALGGLSWLEDTLTFFAVGIYALAGRPRELTETMAALRASLPMLPGWYASRAIAIGHVLLDRGETAAARALASEVAAHQPGHEWPPARCSRLILAGMVAALDRDFAAAEEALLAARDIQERNTLARMLGDADLLLASLYLRWHRPEPARRALEPALRRWRASGLLGVQLIVGPKLLAPLLEYAVANGIEEVWAGRALALIRGLAAPGSVLLPENGALTPREIEVLRMMARGASNRAIAEALVVSLPTVKTHVAHILGKLGVDTRTAAAARARELGLV
jgi:LuxR family transcriptional regulator, maltose regulon positive regulatory protein